MTLSVTALKAMLAQTTDQVVLTSIKVEHTDLEETLYLVNNTQDIVRNGIIYKAFPFQPRLPADTEEENPRARLVIDAVDRSIIEALRSVTADQPTITMEVFLASSPDTTEVGPFVFQCIGATYNEQAVIVDLAYESSFLDEPFTKDSFTPQTAPGMFGN